MNKNSLKEKLSSQNMILYIKEISRKLGLNFIFNFSVKPGDGYKEYSTNFMGAINNKNIYKTDIVGQGFNDNQIFFDYIDDNGLKQKANSVNFIPLNLTVSNCVRLDSLSKSGESNRHLTSFGMLGISGVLEKEKIIDLFYSLISNIFINANSEIINLEINIHPDDMDTKNILLDKGYDIIVNEDENCLFKESNKTDREGYRLEFKINFKNNDEFISWEIINLVIIDSISNIKLKVPIFDGGGSIERFTAIIEGTNDVFNISSFDEYNNYLLNNGISSKNRLIKKVIDQTKALSLMILSGYNLGNKNKQEKSFRNLVKELTLMKLDNNIDDNIISGLLDLILNNLSINYELTKPQIEINNINKYINLITEQFGIIMVNIEKYIEIYNKDTFEIKIIMCLLVYKYTNGSSSLGNLVFKKIGSKLSFDNNFGGKNISECDNIYHSYRVIKKNYKKKDYIGDKIEYYNKYIELINLKI